MCINFDHTLLFSASHDGTIAYLQIQDKDPRKKEYVPSFALTSEIMIPRAKREHLIKYINELRTQIEIHKTSRQRIQEDKMRIKNKELSDLDRKLKIFEEEAAAS